MEEDMKTRVIAMACAALMSLGMVACEGGTVEDDGLGTQDPAVQDDGMGGMDDGMGGTGMDDGMGGVDDGTGDL
jgi:hypothetical protein